MVESPPVRGRGESRPVGGLQAIRVVDSTIGSIRLMASRPWENP